ncbi:MAG: hypothetical protein Q7S40_03505 [Opitutaceae bacterium]|nr:hypothetical protein [Opitutaceae bacterium]
MSAGYNPEQRGAEEFVAAIAGKNYGEVLAGISDLLAFSFFDAPAGGNDDTGENRSYYSFAAVYLDVMGREYGWTFRDVMDCPLPVLFQLIKAIKNRNGGIMFNPLSDRAIQEHVRTLNQ